MVVVRYHARDTKIGPQTGARQLRREHVSCVRLVGWRAWDDAHHRRLLYSMMGEDRPAKNTKIEGMKEEKVGEETIAKKVGKKISFC